MVLDTLPDEFIGGLFPLISYEEYKKREQENENLTDDSSDDQMNFKNDQLIRTPVRRRKISNGLKVMTKAVPVASPGQPRKYRSLDNPVQAYANSDEEEAYTSTINHTHNQSTIEDKENRDAKSNSGSPYYRKTTTTTTTTTISSSASSPNTSIGKVRDDPSVLKIGKQRKSTIHAVKPRSRVSSSEKIIGGSGIRKASSSKKTYIQM